jgi:cation diffusion facilitator family transporter
MGGHHPHVHVPLTAAGALAGDERYRLARRVTLVGSVIDFLLGVLKIVFGYLANSQALIADGIHSFSDLATDAMVLVAAKHGSKDADEEHPYGHGRFETIATVMLGVALIAVAAGIGWDAVDRLFNPEELLQPGMWALGVALASVVLKEWIYHYTMRVARRLRSKMLEANAWHSRSDAISSIVVFVGVGGTMLGLDYLDAVAAVIVALMVAKIGWDLAWHSVQELADAALEAERVEAIRESINDIDGVREVHMLRTRRMGHDALIDVHVLVRPWLSVSEGHMIALSVEQKLKARFEEVSDVTVHVDPEDDETAPPCAGLPLRSKALAMLDEAWSDIDCLKDQKRLLLHYLAGHIHVQVFFPFNCYRGEEHATALRARLQSAVEPMREFGRVEVFYG